MRPMVYHFVFYHFTDFARIGIGGRNPSGRLPTAVWGVSSSWGALSAAFREGPHWADRPKSAKFRNPTAMRPQWHQSNRSSLPIRFRKSIRSMKSIRPSLSGRPGQSREKSAQVAMLPGLVSLVSAID